MKAKKLSPKLGLGAVLVGSFFLISPIFAIIDVLPDFIGYAFILFGVSKLADINDKIAESAALFRRLVILGLVRWGVVFFVYGVSSPIERPTLQLLCSFVLCVLDCVTLIPAWKSLSAGILYLSTRHGGEAVFDKAYTGQPKHDKTLLERMTSATLTFLVAREVLSVLPEFAVLNSSKGGADVATRTALYDYIGFMRSACGLIVLVWGVIWFIGFVRFARHVGKDKVFFAAVTEKYGAEVLSRPELFARRGVKRAMICMCAGLVFSVDIVVSDLYTDPVCVTPDFLMGLLLLAGLWLMRKYVHRGKFAVAFILTLLYTALTVAEWITPLSWMNVGNLYHNAQEYQLWTTAVRLRGVVSVLSVAVILSLVRLLCDVIVRYTGFSVTDYDSAQPSLRIRELHKSLRNRLWLSVGFGAATAASSVVAIEVSPFAAYTMWEAWIVVDVALPILYAVTFIYATVKIFEQIDYKYMLS